jgi:excisionase family DNA binding protein
VQNTALNGSSPTRSEKSAFLSVKDAANYLGVSIFFIYKQLHSENGPPFIKIGEADRKTIRIPKKEFLAWIKRNEGQSTCTS